MHIVFTRIGIAISLAVAAIAANAATKTVTLAIPTMDCPVCPITIKKALSKVPGVGQASVSYDKRQAVVSFDDTKTHVQALTDATKNVGYLSTLTESAP